MEPSIHIDTGIKRILINDGPDYIEFNPSDVLFAEKFYQLIKDFEVKQEEFKTRSDELEKDAKDSGKLVDLAGNIALVREVCIFLRTGIDSLFGEGTSQKLFGDAMVLGAFEQFFTGITPYIKTAREAKIERYVTPAKPRRRKTVVK
jgi:hypothetical protein